MTADRGMTLEDVMRLELAAIERNVRGLREMRASRPDFVGAAAIGAAFEIGRHLRLVEGFLSQVDPSPEKLRNDAISISNAIKAGGAVGVAMDAGPARFWIRFADSPSTEDARACWLDDADDLEIRKRWRDLTSLEPRQ